MNPPTISFASAKGPSVRPAAVRSLPPDLSLPPMSAMLSLNFSCQALKSANISFICAGEGASCFPGALLWISRYFRFGTGLSLGSARAPHLDDEWRPPESTSLPGKEARRDSRRLRVPVRLRHRRLHRDAHLPLALVRRHQRL